ncbi:hypothetical protein [Sulfuricurvum sp.]|uniref:hypothetical protein n=1 Tax=Sulfuricurvum sp. TaxID=2025608 RepID=UPI002E37EE88|nr:hypothetical protein [Sulfuricurvum sp.]HEX5329509.1 hypothetical protein [Sulfuricurvum sp.]
MKPQLISDIVALLDKILPKYLYANDFTTEHYKTLLSKLAVADNEALFDDKKGSIRKGIVKYFSNSNQEIELNVTFSSFALKKKFIDPSKPEAYDRMLHTNSSILLDILARKTDFSPLPYLVSIPEQIRDSIIENFLQLDNNMEHVRQSVRRQVEEIFDLDAKDITFFLRGRISIRFYTPPQKFADGVDKRFGGESVEDMEAMYNAYFPKGAWEYVEPILGEVIEEKLNFGVIDNLTFTRTFIPVFRSMIEILLLEIIRKEDRVKIEGFTGYVLRQLFHDIFVYTAKNLLQFVEIRDKNAEAFIKYFTDEIVVDASGNRIQKYAIVDSKQQRWNYSSILSIIMQYKQVKQKLSTQKETISVCENELAHCQGELAVEKSNRDSVANKLADIEDTITENEAAIERVKAKVGETPEETLSLKSQVNRLNYHQVELLDMKKKTLSQFELSKNKMSNKMSEFTRRQRKLDFEKKSLKTYLEQMASLLETYDMITEALATVLTKR